MLVLFELHHALTSSPNPANATARIDPRIPPITRAWPRTSFPCATT